MVIASMVALDAPTHGVEGSRAGVGPRGSEVYMFDTTPPRQPNLGEYAEMGERARERMQHQLAAQELEDRLHEDDPYRGIRAGLARLLRRVRGVVR
jgi:hypothetical protein